MELAAWHVSTAEDFKVGCTEAACQIVHLQLVQTW